MTSALSVLLRRILPLNLAVFCLLMLPHPVRSQEIFRQDKVVGTDLRRGKDLRADVLTFPAKAGNTYYDRTNELLLVMSAFDERERYTAWTKGELWVYDLATSELVRRQKVRYADNAVYHADGIFVENPGTRAIGYDPRTGKKRWKVKADIYFTDAQNKMAVGYETLANRYDSDVLIGTDMETGAVVWERTISKFSGWNDLYQLNDSVYFILASGLHTLNVRDGSGWSWYTQTAEYRRGAKGMGLGAGLGMFKGSMVSNLEYDSTHVYFASKEKIAKIDVETGRPAWVSEYPDAQVGSSVIFLSEGTLFMVNRGMASSRFGLVHHGAPFLAAYSRDTGHPRFLVSTADSTAPVLSYEALDEDILLLNRETVECYEAATGARRFTEDYAENDIGSPIRFLNRNDTYTKTPDGRYLPLAEVTPGTAFALFDYGTIPAINSDLTVGYTMGIDQIWLKFAERDGLNFLSDGERTMVADAATGELRAELLAPEDGEFFGDALVYTVENQIYILDLSDLFRP